MTTLEIVGSGFSLRNYWKSADVTWGICNTMAIIDHCDMGWFMDDLDYLTLLEKLPPDLNKTNIPIMSCSTPVGFPTAQMYPLNLIVHQFGIDWLNNTVAYAVAYAIATEQFDEIHFHGVDYMTNEANRKQERRCTEMWINYAKHRGIKIKINPLSFLFDTNKKHLAELAPEVSDEMRKLWKLHEGHDDYFYGWQSGLPQLECDWGYNQEFNK